MLLPACSDRNADETSSLASPDEARTEPKDRSLAIDPAASEPPKVKKPAVHPVPYFKNLPADVALLDKIRYTVPDSPGVILVITDTLRPDHLSLYGYDHETSPFVDGLGESGVTFLNHVSSSTWTKTSMASILTGLFPARHGVLEVNSKLDRKQLTVAETFKAAGYKTAAFIANPISGRKYGLTQGFDKVLEPEPDFGGEPPHAGELLGSAATWLKTLKKDEPFFMMVLLFDAHDPYFPPNPWRQDFCADCGQDAILTPEREYRENAPSKKQIEEMRSLYDGEISFMDSELKSFYDLIQGQEALKDRTTFALLADHGEAFGEHGVFEHAFHMWDEVVRTPFILSGNGIKSQGFVADPTSHVDIFPTLLRLAGIPIPEGVQGMSLVHREGGAGFDKTRMLVNEVQMYGIRRVSVRDRLRKLVYHYPLNQEMYRNFYNDLSIYPSVSIEGSRIEYYDLIKDPFETKNLFDPAAPNQDRLYRGLDAYRNSGGLEGLENDTELSDDVWNDLKILGYSD